MGMRTRLVELQFSLHDRVIGVNARRKRGIRRWAGKARIFRERLDPITRYQRRREFMARYRLRPECVNWLAVKFQAHPACQTLGDSRGHRIPILQKVCLALRHLASGGSYRIVKDSQGGCSTSTVHRSVRDFVNFLVCTQRGFIKFPKRGPELTEAARHFKEIYDIDDVVGIVDGTYIPIIKPTRCEWAYVCRKKYHALNIMLIVDAHGKITYIDSSFPGAQHDSTVWALSDLTSKIDKRNRLEGYHLIGDAGYTLLPQLMTPFTAGEVPHLSHPQKRFQKKMTFVRSAIERDIGQVKSKWRAVSRFGAGVVKKKTHHAGWLTVACACLHNIAIDWNVPDVPEGEGEGEDPDFGARIRRVSKMHWNMAVRQAAKTTPVLLVDHARSAAMRSQSYRDGVAKRDEIIYQYFGGENPRAAANFARQQRRVRHRLGTTNSIV